MAGRKLNNGPYVTAGAWDILLEDGLIVELDEDAHFNRYRAQTLNAPWANELPWTDAYLRYCRTFEDGCLSGAGWSKYWESPGFKKMFGPSDPPGILGKAGSSRWKQRALYEAVRDALVMHTPGLSLARISAHDVIAGQSVNQVLYGGGVFAPGALREFLASRTLVGVRP